MGGWESQGWQKKEIAVLRTLGVFRGNHMGIETVINAEGGVQVIRN